MTPSDYIKKYFPFAKKVEAETGIPALAMIAQSAGESGWNETPGNMMFGVKAKRDTPSNRRQLVVTREVMSYPDDTSFPEIISVTKRSDGKYTYIVKDWFMKYNTPEESFTDHAEFFLRNPRYAKALEKRGHPYLFADGVAQAGYATDPNYAATLKDVIKTVERNY